MAAPAPGPSDLAELEQRVDKWLADERRGLWNMVLDFSMSFAGVLLVQLTGTDVVHWTRPLVVSALSAAFWTAFAQVMPKVPRSQISAIVNEIRAHRVP